MMQSVRRRLDCFEFDLSMEHIADGHSSAMALESVSYRRDETQSAVPILRDQIEASFLAELTVSWHFHRARARMVCRRWLKLV